jgi:hypothetical protein
VSVELLKVLVQPIVLERDAGGAIVGERVGEPTALYALDDVARFVETLELELERANNGANGAPLLKGGTMSETTDPTTTEPETPTEPETAPAEPETEGDDNGDDGGEED